MVRDIRSGAEPEDVGTARNPPSVEIGVARASRLAASSPHWLWSMTGPLGAAFASADYYIYNLTPEHQSLDDAAAPARLRHLIQKRVLDALADFGLLEPKPGDDERQELGDARFRPTPLFKRFLRFEIPPEARQRGAS